MNKKCSRCGKYKPLDEFNINKKNKVDGHAYWCKKCVAKHASNRRNEAKKYIREYKQCHPCVICGETDSRILQFHHLKPEMKKYCISDMIKQRSGISTIKEEIAKCCVLCVSCHEKVHSGKLQIYI